MRRQYITVITIITHSHHLHLFALSIMGWILVTSLLFITSLIKLQSVGFVVPKNLVLIHWIASFYNLSIFKNRK